MFYPHRVKRWCWHPFGVWLLLLFINPVTLNPIPVGSVTPCHYFATVHGHLFLEHLESAQITSHPDSLNKEVVCYKHLGPPSNTTVGSPCSSAHSAEGIGVLLYTRLPARQWGADVEADG